MLLPDPTSPWPLSSWSYAECDFERPFPSILLASLPACLPVFLPVSSVQPHRSLLPAQCSPCCACPRFQAALFRSRPSNRHSRPWIKMTMKINMKITAMQRFSKKSIQAQTLHHLLLHDSIITGSSSWNNSAPLIRRTRWNGILKTKHMHQNLGQVPRCMVRCVMLQRSCHVVNHSLDSTPSCTHAVRATVCCKPHPICTTRLPLRPVTN